MMIAHCLIKDVTMILSLQHVHAKTDLVVTTVQVLILTSAQTVLIVWWAKETATMTQNVMETSDVVLTTVEQTVHSLIVASTLTTNKYVIKTTPTCGHVVKLDVMKMDKIAMALAPMGKATATQTMNVLELSFVDETIVEWTSMSLPTFHMITLIVVLVTNFFTTSITFLMVWAMMAERKTSEMKKNLKTRD